MIAALGDRVLSIGADAGRLVRAALPQTAARRDRAPHPPGRIRLGLPVWADRRGGSRAHAVGVRHRIDHQPRRLRPEPEPRVPADGAVPADPRRAGARDDHARRPRRLELRDLCGRSWRRSARSPSTAPGVPGRGSRPSSSRIVLAVVLSEVVRPEGADLPDAFVRTFDVLNIVLRVARGDDVARDLRAGTGDRTGARRGAPPERPARGHRRAPAGGAPHDRGPLRRRQHPLRGRRRLHSACERARRARGRRDARPSVHGLRRARRPLRGREDQDDRRLLHGRGGRSRGLGPTTRTRLPALRSR